MDKSTLDGTGHGGRRERFLAFLTRRDLGLWMAALAVLLASPSLVGGMSSDDCILRGCLLGVPDLPEVHRAPWDGFTFCRGDPEALRNHMDRGLMPWWAPLDLRLAFWRPFASLSHWLDFTLYPDRPALMHLHSLLWFAAVAAGATALYRRLFDAGATAAGRAAWAGGLAALLYAIDEAHGFPVGWLSNRNAVMGTAFGIMVLICHDRWRREQWRMGLPAGLVCLALGLGCGEAALATTGYLAAYALWIERGAWRVRVATLVPYAAVSVAWLFAYVGLGYGASGSGQYRDPLREPILFLSAMAARLPVLLLSQLGFPSSSLWPYLSWGPAAAQVALAVAFLGFVAWVLWPLFRRDGLARFWATGMVLSTLPVCATYPNDRLLFFTGLGGMGLVAQFFGTRSETVSFRRRPARVLAVCWIVIHGILAPVSLPVAAFSPRLAGRFIERVTDALAEKPGVARPRDLVIVNTPTDYLIPYVPFRRIADGERLPDHMWTLSAGLGAVDVRRTDDRTLVVTPDGGFLADGWSRVLRGPGYPLEPGYTVALPGLEVRVLDVTDDGRPVAVAFTFSTSLDDPERRFAAWVGRTYVPFEAPNVGGTVRLPPVPWYWAL